MIAYTLKDFWTVKLRDAGKTNPVRGKTSLAAYNVVIDYVELVTGDKLEALTTPFAKKSKEILALADREPKDVGTPEEFTALLLRSVRDGKALEVTARDPLLLAWLFTQFAGPDSKRLGGQAGIIASQLAALGAKSILYAPGLTRQHAALARKGVLAPVVKNNTLALAPASALAERRAARVNWIFEYKPGTRVSFGGQAFVAPRANRLIISSQAKPQPGFGADVRPFLPQLGANIDAGFFSGYQRLKEACAGNAKACNAFLAQEEKDLTALKKRNPAAVLHYEYVTIDDPKLEKNVLHVLAKPFDSLGLNEVELRHVLRAFKHEREAKAIERDESAFTLYQGALRLLKDLALQRIQVHNLGYFVIVVRKPYPRSLESVVKAALFASHAANARTELGREPTFDDVKARAKTAKVSDAGLNQVLSFSTRVIYDLKKSKAEFDSPHFLREGTWETPDHAVLVIPAEIARTPRLTVGLGDVISSTTLLAENAEPAQTASASGRDETRKAGTRATL